MNKKTVIAKLYDPENDNYLSDITLDIELVKSFIPEEKPHYKVTGRFNKMTIEFSDKNLIVELKPSLRGYAHFSIVNNAGWFTEYKIVFQDSVWRGIEWFENL